MRFQLKYQLLDGPTGPRYRTLEAARRGLAGARRQARLAGDSQGIALVDAETGEAVADQAEVGRFLDLSEKQGKNK